MKYYLEFCNNYSTNIVNFCYCSQEGQVKVYNLNLKGLQMARNLKRGLRIGEMHLVLAGKVKSVPSFRKSAFDITRKKKRYKLCISSTGKKRSSSNSESLTISSRLQVHSSNVVCIQAGLQDCTSLEAHQNTCPSPADQYERVALGLSMVGWRLDETRMKKTELPAPS